MAPSVAGSDYRALSMEESRVSMGSFEYADDPSGASSSAAKSTRWVKQQLGRSHHGWLQALLPLATFVLGLLLAAGLISTETVALPPVRGFGLAGGKQAANSSAALAAAAATERMKVLRTTDALPKHIANNLGLNRDECEVAFPLLWPEVEATKASFAEEGITRQHLDAVEQFDGTLLAIVDNQLYIKRFHGEWKKRNEAIIASLYQAIITSPEPFPDVEFWFRATDSLEPGGWFALNKRPGEALWLLPDFGLYSWPEPGLKGWPDYRRRAAAVESQVDWTTKENKLFFRGAMLSPLRQDLLSLSQSYEWGDVRGLDWGNQEDLVLMEDHCRHKWLASIEGMFAYSGRLKYLLMCHSVVVSHKMQWIQHFHGALVGEGPNQNIVELPAEAAEGDWKQLPETMDRLLGDDAYARNIADNAVRTMRDRYLTPAATTCYWRRVLAEYASLQRFTPEIGKGVDYESFSLLFMIEWKPFK